MNLEPFDYEKYKQGRKVEAGFPIPRDARIYSDFQAITTPSLSNFQPQKMIKIAAFALAAIWLIAAFILFRKVKKWD